MDKENKKENNRIEKYYYSKITNKYGVTKIYKKKYYVKGTKPTGRPRKNKTISNNNVS